MAANSNQNVFSFMHEAKITGCGALLFAIGMAAGTAGLYRTNGGKKHLYSFWSIPVGVVTFLGLSTLVIAWKNPQRYRKLIAGAPAWMKTIQTSIILIFMILVCNIGEGSLGGIAFFFGASIGTLGLLPLFLNDLGLMDFFIGGAINTAVVRYSLGGGTWAVLVGCILIIFLRNLLEKRFAIPAATIETRDEEIQAPQIGVAIPAAAIEMRRDEDVQAPEIQAPEIGVAIPPPP